ncbi:hypothetical protein [Streptomyces sp. NPDC052107]|uniref:hypothetical protein n=1 Tax=Streptomyces sp. NPDC052107 TaxID=3155632 RepID=UPI00341B13D6
MPPPAAGTYDTAAGPPRPEALTRIMLRPLGSSLPLGFFAFGTGSVLLSAVQLQWVPLAQGRPVMLLVLVFVVPLELLSGVFAFLAGTAARPAACPCWAVPGRAPRWSPCPGHRDSPAPGWRCTC